MRESLGRGEGLALGVRALVSAKGWLLSDIWIFIQVFLCIFERLG